MLAANISSPGVDKTRALTYTQKIAQCDGGSNMWTQATIAITGLLSYIGIAWIIVDMSINALGMR